MLKHKVIDIPIYRGKLIIIASDDAGAVVKKFSLDEDYFDDELYAHSIVDDYNGWMGYYVILNPNHSFSKLTNGTIAHEAMHVVFEKFADNGVIITHKNQEPTTYLLGWITDEIHAALKEWKIKL